MNEDNEECNDSDSEDEHYCKNDSCECEQTGVDVTDHHHSD